MDENPYQAPQDREQSQNGVQAERETTDEKHSPPATLLFVISAMMGVLILLQALLGQLAPLLWPNYLTD
jgi:hypothetical protein